MGVSPILEFYWQALLPSGNRLEKTLPRLYQTGEGSSKHSESVIGSGSGIDARVAFLAGRFFATATYIKGPLALHWRGVTSRAGRRSARQGPVGAPQRRELLTPWRGSGSAIRRLAPL